MDDSANGGCFLFFFFILYLTSAEIIFTIYNFIYIDLTPFAIETTILDKTVETK